MLKTTLEQWRMFKAVVECGGFAQAAASIHKSQSSIHHAVHKLEQSLGVALLKVVGRKAELTEAGELMLRRANYLLAEAGKIEALAASVNQGVETHLRLAVDETFPRDGLCSALAAVSARYPQLRIELYETVLSGGGELLARGVVDLALSPRPRDGSLAEQIYRRDFIAVASPEFPLCALDRPLTFEDLKSERQIVIRDSALDVGADSGWLGAEQRWTVSHLATSVDLVRRGLGFAWLPESAIAALLADGHLQRLPLERGSQRSASLYLTLNDADTLGPAAHYFIEQLRNQPLK